MEQPLGITEFRPEEIPEVTGAKAADEEITVALKWKIPLVGHGSLSGGDTVKAMLESREPDASVPGNGGWMVLYPPPFSATEGADYAVVGEDEGVPYRMDEVAPAADKLRYPSERVGRSRSMPWSGLLDRDLSSGMLTLVDTRFCRTRRTGRCCDTKSRDEL